MTRYLRLLSLALPAALLFRATYAFNVAVSRPKVMMTVQVAGLGLKIVLNYALIFGHFGLPRLGAVGCGLASLIVYWALFLMGVGLHRIWIAATGASRSGWRGLAGAPWRSTSTWVSRSGCRTPSSPRPSPSWPC